jgi:threonine/homoserine/homoserine lactone efflux protein
MAITLIIFILYGLAAHSVRKYVINSPKILVGLQRSFAVTFAALGLKLAATDR